MGERVMRGMRATEVVAVLRALADEAAIMSPSNGDYQADPSLRSDLLAAAENAEAAGQALVAAAGRMRGAAWVRGPRWRSQQRSGGWQART